MGATGVARYRIALHIQGAIRKGWPDRTMTQAKVNPIFRLMPSLTDVAFLMPLVFLFTRMDGVRTMLGDGDTGWHVRTGEWILAHGRIPHADIFSFTRPGQPWFAWEWLWDASFAWLFHHGGMGTVVLVNMLIICLTFAMLFRLVNRMCGNPVVAIGLTVLAAAASSIHWLARPHLMTMVFCVIFLDLIDRARRGRTRLLYWLPVLTIPWTNLHGGFLAGILILCAYGAGEAARALLASTPEQRRAALRMASAFFATGGASLAASLVNPYFYHLHAHLYAYLDNPYEMKNISEFQGTNFQNGGSGFFEAMLVIALGAAIWYAARKQFAEVFLVAGWAHLGLLSGRNIPLFMICAAPAAAVAMVAWLRKLENAELPAWLRSAGEVAESAGEEIGPIDRMWRVHALPAVVFAGLALGIASPAAGKMLRPVYDEKAYPARALAMLEPSDRVFTHDEWGDYLIYMLSPGGGKVYIDGRSDFYGEKFCEEYIGLMGVKYDWEQTLSKYGVDTVLLPPDTALASTIKESSHWRVVYDDGSAIVFRRANAPRTGDETSTGIRGGGSDPSITQMKGATAEDRAGKLKGANPL